ncbi:SDR family oxidoreductase [Streptomyces sp. NPDC050509]|uniref:SDR family oxidoreductase n=1 Tax=Streptomyces sp. NPDC050509 TaxID=3365620 RepID=UPI00378B1798
MWSMARCQVAHPCSMLPRLRCISAPANTDAAGGPQASAQNGGRIAEAVPLRRMSEADKVSSLVLFLASDDSSYISGTEHIIDGGLTPQ